MRRSGSFSAAAAIGALVLSAGFATAAGHSGSPSQPSAVSAPIRIDLGVHRFRHLRDPEAIVVRAKAGDGPAELGVACPEEGICSTPSSLDVDEAGSIWVVDPANHRLMAWHPDRSRVPFRTMPLSFTPADIAVAPGGIVYVTGVQPGSFRGVRLYALDPDGSSRWTGRPMTDTLNDHIRLGPGGILYSVSTELGWAPAVDSKGRPVGRSAQVRSATDAQPVTGGRTLSVSGTTEPGHDAPRVWSVTLTGSDGAPTRRWRILSGTDLGLCLEAVPATIAGDPVLVFEAYKYDEHLMEHVVVRLASTGLADVMSLGRGGYRGGLTITDVRVGPDGKVYQLETDPAAGISVKRYALAGTAPTPAPSAIPTAQPTRRPPSTASVEPTASPSPRPSTAPTPSPPSSSTPPIATASASLAPSAPTQPNDPGAALIAIATATAIVAAGAWMAVHAGLAHGRR